MTYTVTVDGEEFLFDSLERAYDRFDGEDHAVLTKSGWRDGEYTEKVIDEK